MAKGTLEEPLFTCSLYTCIPVHLYTFVHLHTCTHVNMYTCIPLSLYTYVHLYTCTPVYLYKCKHPYTCTLVQLYTIYAFKLVYFLKTLQVHLYTCTPVHMYTRASRIPGAPPGISRSPHLTAWWQGKEKAASHHCDVLRPAVRKQCLTNLYSAMKKVFF